MPALPQLPGAVDAKDSTTSLETSLNCCCSSSKTAARLPFPAYSREKRLKSDRQGPKLLCQVVVEFISNATAFDFLCVEQLSSHFPQMFFRLSSIREVDTTTDITEKSAVGSVSRYAIMKHPSINAVVTQQPILQGEVLSRFERGKISTHATFSIFGMDARNPILLHLLFRRQPGKVQPWLIEERATRVRARHPQHDRSHIYQRSKALLTFS